MIPSLNFRIGKLSLNIVDERESVSSGMDGSEWGAFAKEIFADALEESLDECRATVKLDEYISDIRLGTIEIDLGEVADLRSEFPSKLKDVLKKKLIPAIVKECSMPVVGLLSDYFSARFPGLERSALEERFVALLQHSNSLSADPLKIAETIIMQMHCENPNFDVNQAAFSIFKKMGELREAEKRKKLKLQGAVSEFVVLDAGIVLLGPWIRMLFDKLGYLKCNEFVDFESQQKASLLLRYVVAGDVVLKQEASSQNIFGECSMSDFLCGLPMDNGFPDGVTLKAEETSLANSLIEGATSNWSALGKTSVNGFRGSFLHREGLVEFKNGDQGEFSLLTVKATAYDILIDRIPWSFSSLKLPWQKMPLTVKWR